MLLSQQVYVDKLKTREKSFKVLHKLTLNRVALFLTKSQYRSFKPTLSLFEKF